jgi:hypothetical protein
MIIMGMIAVAALIVILVVAVGGASPGTPAGYTNMANAPAGDIIGDEMYGVSASGDQGDLASAVEGEINGDSTLVGSVYDELDPNFTQGTGIDGSIGVNCQPTKTTGLIECTLSDEYTNDEGVDMTDSAYMLVRVSGSTIVDVYVSKYNVGSDGSILLT